MRIVKHVGIALIAASVAWGCSENKTEDRKVTPTQQLPQQNQTQTPDPQNVVPNTPNATSGELDAYGRAPGDAHYGHDHPPLEEDQNSPMQQTSPVKPQQDAPASGELDKYGRAPGDEHYGHDHP